MFFIFLVRVNTHGLRCVLENSHGVTRMGLQEREGGSHDIIPLAALSAQVATHPVAIRRRSQWVIQSYRDRPAPLNT